MQQEPRQITPDDVAVTLAVRADLGPEHEPAVIAEFLDRVGSAIDARVDERVQAQAPRAEGVPAVAIVSLVMGIPITAVAAEQGIGGIVIAWAGIAAVNVAAAIRR